MSGLFYRIGNPAGFHIDENHERIITVFSEEERIFMERMLLCRKAAEKLGLKFKLSINEQQLI